MSRSVELWIGKTDDSPAPTRSPGRGEIERWLRNGDGEHSPYSQTKMRQAADIIAAQRETIRNQDEMLLEARGYVDKFFESGGYDRPLETLMREWLEALDARAALGSEG